MFVFLFAPLRLRAGVMGTQLVTVEDLDHFSSLDRKVQEDNQKHTICVEFCDGAE